MSRVSYCDDEERPGQFAIFNANVHRSIKGRKGQAALRELRDALLALPSKRLVRNAVALDGEVCALGALAAWKMAQAHEVTIAVAVDQLEPQFGDADAQAYADTVEFGEELGVPHLVAWKLVMMNDVDLDYKYGYMEGPLPYERRWEYTSYNYRGVATRWEMTPEERYEKILKWVEEQLA